MNPHITYCDLHLAPVILEEEPCIMLRRQVARGILSPRPLAAAPFAARPDYHPPLTLGREPPTTKAPATLVPTMPPHAKHGGIPEHLALCGTAGAIPMPGMAMPGRAN